MNMTLIDVVRTARGGMKSVDPGLTTNGEGILQMISDTEARKRRK